ncbi:hypothetical protein EYZ11_012081 [Aspergillus tanneri]|uniref:Cucumopine synthase C-terminal helical bundle domain-containing protein n=1 Tax=Aspergillus tanneri TaxID=1220188 RepID=A0A4S3J152_9EURO|nr:uncharacterized protein ATNIH1004_005516 [Aspergillus tanneri]KAA8646841.1 hypothetical protein ATNIH1004_005516 [Aspergillus tanneri]THC88470.1 hypothetical protein EYZ11_012081 [Aspergillus tanneri]
MTGSVLEETRTIKIKWPSLGITVTALMNVMENSQLIDLLFRCLPYRSLQSHALVSGDHLYHIIPQEELIHTPAIHKVPNRADTPDGTVFLSRNQHMAIKYGPLSEYLPAAPCGMVIPEDIPKLRNAGDGLWRACYETAQAIDVVVWDATQPEPVGSLPLQIQRTGVNEEVKNIIREIHVKTNRSWSGLSEDLEIVHKGLAPSGAGSKGSYFHTMVFLQGQIRALGYTVLNNIIRMAATQPHFGLEHLITMYRVLGSPIAEFCGYMGTDSLLEMYEAIDAAIKHGIENNPNQVVAREDFLAMVSAFAQYVTLLNAQSLQLFPWRHGEDHRIALPAP